MGDRDDPVLAYWKWLMTLPSPWQWPWEDYSKREQDRSNIHTSFPYIVTVERGADELRKLEKWCWNEFGVKDGKCKKESCWSDEERLLYTDSAFILGLQIQDYNPPATGEHLHEGTWTTVWALKTTYEDGFCDFCFKQSDHAVFFKFTFGFEN